jgi:hypothetical protein
MSENRMIGEIDAKRKREGEIKLRKKNQWPWEEYEKLPDGSERGIEGYVRVITPDDGRPPFEIRGTVRWWRHRDVARK